MEIQEKAKPRKKVGEMAWSDATDSCSHEMKAISATADTYEVQLTGTDGCRETFDVDLIHVAQDMLNREAYAGGSLFSTATLWRKD